MEHKTTIEAADGRHDLTITRQFDLPVELLFKAYQDADLFEQWMSHDYGKVEALKYESQKQGGYTFQTSDAQGNVIFTAWGVFHDFEINHNITRTFEMTNSPFGAQLEFLLFEKLTAETSKLTIRSLFKSCELRDEMLKLPFAFGLNMAHNRLQDVLNTIK